MKVKSLCLVRLLATPWTAAYQAPPSMGFSRQEYWSGLPLPFLPWTARRSKKSILKEFSPRCSLEGLMLKLKLHYFGHLMRIVDSLENTLMLGKIGGRRRRGRQRMRWLDGTEEAVPGLSVFPSREPGMSGKFWMSHEGCQVACLTSRRNMGLPLRVLLGPGHTPR